MGLMLHLCALLHHLGARLLGLLLLRLGVLLRRLGMSLLLSLGTLLRRLGMGLLSLLLAGLGLCFGLALAGFDLGLLARLGLTLLRLGTRLLRRLGMGLLRLLSRALLLLALLRLSLSLAMPCLLLRRHLQALLLRLAGLLLRLGTLMLLGLQLLAPIVRVLGGVALHLRLLLRCSLMLRRLSRLLLGERLLALRLGELLLTLLLLRALLLLHLLLALLLRDLLLASTVAITAAEPAATRRRCGRRDRLRRRAVETDLLPAVEPLRLGLALLAFFGPMLAFLGVMLLVIGLPFRLARAVLRPLRARRRDVRAPRRPVGRDDAPVLTLAGKAVQIDRAGIITRGIVRPATISARRQQGAAIVVDGDELVARIAITVIGAAHEIGRVGPRLVIIVTVAAIDRFGILHVAIAGLPRPGRNVAVVIGIIRRCIADRVEHAVGAIEIGIGLRGLSNARQLHRRRGRERRHRRRRVDRGRRALLQGHRIGQRGERAIGVRALVAGRGRLVAGGERQSHRGSRHQARAAEEGARHDSPLSFDSYGEDHGQSALNSRWSDRSAAVNAPKRFRAHRHRSIIWKSARDIIPVPQNR